MNTDLLNPYPGLRPFTEEEQTIFFGRERHIDEILKKLHQYRFVSIVGHSGSGKSSLIRAGIIPKLKADGWQICNIKPGNDPVLSLATALKEKFGTRIVAEQELMEMLAHAELGLVQALRYALKDTDKLLILVDQFEEIFNGHGGADESFRKSEILVNNLLAAVSQTDVPIYVSITMRSDFLGDCEQLLGLPEKINEAQFLIPRMRKEEIARSITGPAQLSGVKISPRLLQHLLNETDHNPDQLPVLQHTLMRTFIIWQQQNEPDAPIDMLHYNLSGTMESALSQHAEEAFLDLNEYEQKVAEGLFKTLTMKTADARGLRRPTTVSQLALILDEPEATVMRVAEVFRQKDRGFIMPVPAVVLSKDTVLDISHESLMRVWDRLRKWADEEYEEAQLYHRITESANLFQENKAGLWRNPDLALAAAWLGKQKNRYWADQYNRDYDFSKKFIQAGMQEQQMVKQQKHRNLLLLRTAAVLAIVILSSLTLWALFEQRNSKLNEQIALNEKHNADEQAHFAKQQQQQAETNYNKALQQEKETQTQKRAALHNAALAEDQRKIAERESKHALQEKDRAEVEKKTALQQKTISDSLRIVSQTSEERANRLRMLAIAQNLAIKSRQIPEGKNNELKALLALKSYDVNAQYHGKPFDAEILGALFESHQALLASGERMYTHPSMLRSVAYCDNGNTLVASSNNGELVFLPSQTFSRARIETVQPNLILKNLQRNPLDPVMYCAGDDKKLQQFGYTGALQLKKFATHPEEITDLIVGKDILISACADHKIRLINTATAAVGRLVILNSKPLALAMDKNESGVFVACENGKLYRLSLPQLLVTDSMFVSESRLTAICVLGSSDAIAIGDETGTLTIVSINSHSVLHSLHPHNTSVIGIRYSASTNLLLVAGLYGNIAVYTTTALKEKPYTAHLHDAWIFDIALSPNGEEGATVSKDRTLRCFMISPTRLAEVIRGRVNRSMTQEEWTEQIGKEEVP